MATKVAVVVKVGSEEASISLADLAAARRFSDCLRNLFINLKKTKVPGPKEQRVPDPFTTFKRCSGAR